MPDGREQFLAMIGLENAKASNVANLGWKPMAVGAEGGLVAPTPAKHRAIHNVLHCV